MTLTTHPATTDPSDLAALNLSRLIDRLEHNLLSPNADLKSLRRSEYQRMRVGTNIEYARATLQALERSLPQIKPVDRRHELQSSLARNRQTLKQVQNVLDEIQAEEEIRASARGNGWDLVEDDEDADSDAEDLLATPEDTADEDTPGLNVDTARKTSDAATVADAPPATTTSTVDAGPSATLAPTAPLPAALRNRHHIAASPSSSTPKATATGSSLHNPTPTPGTQGAETEKALASDRHEQENLTSSLLDLATQLKTSSQQFQASLEAEKSVLARAAEGLDRTTGNLAVAERRMGMLRRMTEGKGWWGRMMLYAWIFGLWVVAILIVFVGPKLRY